MSQLTGLIGTYHSALAVGGRFREGLFGLGSAVILTSAINEQESGRTGASIMNLVHLLSDQLPKT